MSPRNLLDKVWDAHTVRELPGGQTQLFIGLHLIHEVTSPQAFAMLREMGVKVRFPQRTFATVDHIIPTHSQRRPLADSLAEEMLVALERNAADTAGATQIRRHMEQIRRQFAAGDFRLPGFVHARSVPGTEVMAARRAAIAYTVESLPQGAALRLRTSDTTAIAAIHEFLAFQRQDHHAGAERDS
jgi:hypothetical protein